MKITSVRVNKFNKEVTRLRGFASVVIDESFAVHDIRILEGDQGLYLDMPSRKQANGEYRDIAHPINREVRAMFEEVILDAYKKAEDEPEKDA